MVQRTSKSIALEKITKQMTSREATERVLEESSRAYAKWLEEAQCINNAKVFEYWIINIYHPPKT